MNFRIFSFFLLGLNFLTCKKPNYDLNNIYPGDKLVINGYVNSDSGCIVHVSKSIPSTGNIPYDQLTVKDARVFLYENGDSIQELVQDTKGHFKSINFLPKVGFFYRIRSTSLSLQTAESEEVQFEDLQLSEKATTVYSKDLKYGAGYIFTFKLNFDTSKIHYYFFNPTGDGKDVETYFIQPSGIEKSCGLYQDYFKYYVSSSCFTTGDSLSIGVGTDNYSGNKPTTLKLNISTISPILYKYITALGEPVGADFAFFEPALQFSNIKGGFGIFYTKNTKSFTK